MHRARYRDHAIPARSDVPSSLGRMVGIAGSDPGFVHRRARDAYHEQRGFWLPWEAFNNLPTEVRLHLEAWARREYGRPPVVQNGGR